MTIEMGGIELAAKGTYRPPATAGRWQPTGEMKRSTSTSMRKLAVKLKGDHAEMGAHLHIEDAARALDRNDHDAASRHLTAAIANMAPQSLYRHGIVHDEDYHLAKQNMDAIHRHQLLVKDIQDAHERNLSLISHTAMENRSHEPPEASDGANSPKPAPRPGEPTQHAMNAPGKTPSGGSDPAVAQPRSVTTWNVTKQIAASNPTIDLAGSDCYRCGTPNAPDARYCKRCANGIIPAQPYDRFASEDVTCPWCGRGDDADAVFCDQCGKGMGTVGAVAASNDDLTVTDLAFHFNPLEARNQHGQWTKDDVAKAADELDKMTREMHNKDGSAYWEVGDRLGSAARKMRAGKVHKAAAMLDEARQTMDRSPSSGGGPSGDRHWYRHRKQNLAKMAEMAGHLRTAQVADPGYTARLEDENRRLAKWQDNPGNEGREPADQHMARAAEMQNHINALNNIAKQQEGKPAGPYVAAALRSAATQLASGNHYEAAVQLKRLAQNPHLTQQLAPHQAYVAKAGRQALDELQLASDALATVIELGHYNPRQPRDRHGRWTHGGVESFGPMGVPHQDVGNLARAHHAEEVLDRARVASEMGTARSVEKAATGTHEHAQELRRLATEADLHHSRNYWSLRGSREGTASYEVSRMAAGIDKTDVPESDISRTLRRAASMVDRGQPSLARLHAGTLHSLARDEAKGNPAFAARLHAAAMKLEALPTGKGMTALPAQSTSEEQRRTAQAQRYAGSIQASNTYEMSAQTARLAVTPSPRGRPGGPGLYRVKGLQHSPYLQNIVKALIRDGKDPSSAYAIARASIRKWSRGGGKVHPEVRAASGAAEAQEDAAQARAHAHSNYAHTARTVDLGFHFNKAEPRGGDGEWIAGLGGLADKLDSDHPGEGIGEHVRKAREAAGKGDIDTAGTHLQAAKDKLRDRKFYAGGKGDMTYRQAAGNSFLLEQKIRQLPGAMGMASDRRGIELTGTAAGAQKDPRIPPGQVGAGRFGASGGAQGGKKPPAKGGKPTAHQAHQAHVAHQGKVAKSKAGLMAQASKDRAEAAQLEKQRAALIKAIAAAMKSASGKVSHGQKGSTTSSGSSTTKSTAPPPKGGTTAPKSGKPGKPGTAPKPGSLAAMKAQLGQLNAQIKTLLTQAAQATAQASKM